MDLGQDARPGEEPLIPEASKTPVGLFARGLGMGLADLVPGVSGGTIAFLTGIHPRLLRVLHTSPSFLLRGRLRSIDWPFILLLGSGILTAILVGSQGIDYVLGSYPTLAMALFAGLILGAFVVVVPKQRDWASLLRILVPGALVAYLAYAGAIQLTDGPLGLAVGGFVALAIMLLPGLSGSAMLVLLGLYEPIVALVADRDVLALLPFMLGGILGLFLCAKVLGSWFEKRPLETRGVLSGLLLGSIVSVWPWRTQPGFGLGAATWPSLDVWVLVVAGAGAFVLLLERRGSSGS